MILLFYVVYLCVGYKMGDVKYIDLMICDGLWDVFNGYYMGQIVENVVEKWQISCDQQDEFVLVLQNKVEVVQKVGKFDDEVIVYIVKYCKGDIIVDKDEYICYGVMIEGM